MISLLSRTSVNNKDIIRMYLGYNLFIFQKTVSINALFDFLTFADWTIKFLY